MDAALAQSGQLNLKGYREELQEMAKALQNETGVAEGEWIGVLTRLTQFGARRDDIKGSAEAVKNLAGVLGGDLQSAALMVGKALQGEFASFSRLGIEIDQHATQAEKLEKLYGALSRMGGGQLAAANDTLAGSFKVLKNGFTDFLQLNGRVMAGGTLLKDVMYGLGTSMSWVSDKLSPPIAKTKQLKDSTEALTGAMISSEERARAQATAFDQIKESISGADTQLQKYLGTLKAEEGRKQNELDAKHNLAKAKIDADLKAGRITPAQAAVAKAAAEESHARASADLKKGTLKKEGQWVTEEVETERQKIRTADVEAGEAKRKREAAENMLNARGRIMKRFGADSKELAEFDALYGQPNPTAIAKLRDEDQAATERASKTRETSGSRIDKLRGDQGRIDADVNSLETIESLNSRRRAIERGGAVIPRQGVAPTIAANTAPGADPSAALETYQKQAAHWKSVADKLSRIVNISTAQAKQLDIATANDAALESRISMLEFQIQNGRR
ncbi:MAG TPA: hypothetical protein VM680_18665 [Verrucomicrobiae bacterium]|nr:hypothetical protein [Verrucomicrobiae bacterium]